MNIHEINNFAAFLFLNFARARAWAKVFFFSLFTDGDLLFSFLSLERLRRRDRAERFGRRLGNFGYGAKIEADAPFEISSGNQGPRRRRMSGGDDGGGDGPVVRRLRPTSGAGSRRV